MHTLSLSLSPSLCSANAFSAHSHSLSLSLSLSLDRKSRPMCATAVARGTKRARRDISYHPSYTHLGATSLLYIRMTGRVAARKRELSRRRSSRTTRIADDDILYVRPGVGPGAIVARIYCDRPDDFTKDELIDSPAPSFTDAPQVPASRFRKLRQSWTYYQFFESGTISPYFWGRSRQTRHLHDTK